MRDASNVVRAGHQHIETQEPETDTRRARETRIGKSIFYVTVALGIWFFYWFAGIQCPC